MLRAWAERADAAIAAWPGSAPDARIDAARATIAGHLAADGRALGPIGEAAPRA